MKKTDQVTIRLPEHLRNYENFGFNSMTDFVKAAIIEYQENHLSIVKKSADLLVQLSELITILEALRDDNSSKDISDNIDNPTFTIEMEDHYEACYRAAKELASTKLMLNSSLNQIETPIELREEGASEKMYKFTWAL